MGRFKIIGYNGQKLSEGLSSLPVVLDSENNIYTTSNIFDLENHTGVWFQQNEVNEYLNRGLWTKLDEHVDIPEDVLSGGKIMYMRCVNSKIVLVDAHI